MSQKNINKHVGKRLRRRRTTLGLSLHMVGKALGIASQQVQKYEKGNNMMNVARLYQFALFLDVPVTYFFDGMKPSKRDKKKRRGRQHGASDREAMEIIKSFKNIQDKALRKRFADFVRMLAIKTRHR